MATATAIGVNQAGRAAAESINVLISARLGRKLTYAQSFIVAEQILRTAFAAGVPADAGFSADTAETAERAS